MLEPPTAFVSKSEVLSRFNEGGYLERVQHGELVEDVIQSNHPSPPLAKEPFCTQSQLIEYRTQRGIAVAIVHQ